MIEIKRPIRVPRFDAYSYGCVTDFVNAIEDRVYPYIDDINEYVDQLITDHKAVVETMQKKIDELEVEILDYRYRLGLRGGVENKFDN